MTSNSFEVRTRLMLGNEAIAHACLESGARFISCYPGTPSSEVVETLLALSSELQKNERPVVEYSINEKVALEAACGAALAGAPSMACMKHVGLNVAADPLFTSAYIGMPGGLVLLSADDPGCHSSQNEQDNRHYARSAHIPCFEPASAAEAREMTVEAFRMARELEQPIMLRTTTRISHSRGPVTPGQPSPVPGKGGKPFSRSFVPVPAVAKVRHKAMLAQIAKAAEMSEASRFNHVFYPAKTGKLPGIIASGAARAYLADALKELKKENAVAMFELGMTWPLPRKKLKDFMAACDKILILEEGEPILEEEIKSFAGKDQEKISGKNDLLTELGEYSTSMVKARIAQWLGEKGGAKQSEQALDLPRRPPNLCPGCAHRSVYYAARKVFGDDAVYSSDIGCYTLGLLPPLKTADFAICMGSSISAGSGFAAASGDTVVAFIGDSTFFHSGITGLANAVFNKRDLLLIILDNGTTAMTGHQPNPGMAQGALGEHACQLDIGRIIDGLGVACKKTVKGHNLAGLLRSLKELKAMKGVRVLIVQEPCLLFAKSVLKRKQRPVAKVISQCQSGETCLRELACPAFMRVNGALTINEDMCGGCMLCVQIAPEAFQTKKKQPLTPDF